MKNFKKGHIVVLYLTVMMAVLTVGFAPVNAISPTQDGFVRSSRYTTPGEVHGIFYDVNYSISTTAVMWTAKNARWQPSGTFLNVTVGSTLSLYISSLNIESNLDVLLLTYASDAEQSWDWDNAINLFSGWCEELWGQYAYLSWEERQLAPVRNPQTVTHVFDTPGTFILLAGLFYGSSITVVVTESLVTPPLVDSVPPYIVLQCDNEAAIITINPTPLDWNWSHDGDVYTLYYDTTITITINPYHLPDNVTSVVFGRVRHDTFPNTIDATFTYLVTNDMTPQTFTVTADSSFTDWSTLSFFEGEQIYGRLVVMGSWTHFNALPAPTLSQPRILRFAIDNTSFIDNGSPRMLEAAPFIANDRTMVPLRVIGEALGATNLEFNAGIITFDIGGQNIVMTVGQPLPNNMGTPVIVAERTFVPLAFIAAEMGATARWDSNTRAAYIYID